MTVVNDTIYIPVETARDGTNQVGTIVFTYTVDWTENRPGKFGNGALGTVNVTVTNILIDCVEDTYELVNITVPEPTIDVVLNDDKTYRVVITITLDEPEQYLAVDGKNITFDVTFTVVPKAE